MATAVVVAVDEPRNIVAVVPSLKVDDLPAAALDNGARSRPPTVLRVGDLRE